MPEANKTSVGFLRGPWPRRLGHFALAAALFVLMLVTVVDVIGRDLFNSPLRGGYELSGLLLMLLFFLALPFATLRGEHITVGLIDGFAGARLARVLDALASLAAAVALGFVAWHVYRKGLTALRYGEATMFLRIPLAPFALLGAGSLGLTVLALLWRAVAILRGEKPAAGGDDV